MQAAGIGLKKRKKRKKKKRKRKESFSKTIFEVVVVLWRSSKDFLCDKPNNGTGTYLKGRINLYI